MLVSTLYATLSVLSEMFPGKTHANYGTVGRTQLLLVWRRW
jgi:hypothetical protein